MTCPARRAARSPWIPFITPLPFTLTDAQRRAVEDAIGDMTAGRPMNRLCQGDVGSGKTMAAACIWFAAQSERWQSAPDGPYGDPGPAAL